jgi:hypothetical protein
MHIPLVHVSVAHLWQYVYPPYCINTSEKVTGENMKEMEIHGPSLYPPTGPRSTFLYDEIAMLFTSLQCLVSTCVLWESVTVWWMWHNSVDTILFGVHLCCMGKCNCDECGTVLLIQYWLVSTCVVWESVTVLWMWHNSVDTILFPDTAAHFDGSASITVKQFWS